MPFWSFSPSAASGHDSKSLLSAVSTGYTAQPRSPTFTAAAGAADGAPGTPAAEASSASASPLSAPPASLLGKRRSICNGRYCSGMDSADGASPARVATGTGVGSAGGAGGSDVVSNSSSQASSPSLSARLHPASRFKTMHPSSASPALATARPSSCPDTALGSATTQQDVVVEAATFMSDLPSSLRTSTSSSLNLAPSSNPIASASAAAASQTLKAGRSSGGGSSSGSGSASMSRSTSRAPEGPNCAVSGDRSLAGEVHAFPGSSGEATGVKVVPALFDDADPEDVINLVADMLARLVEHNDHLPLHPSSLTRFHSRAAPQISVLSYLRRIAKYTSLEKVCTLILLIYIDRVSSTVQGATFTICTLTVHRFVCAATVCASKALCDAFSTNGHYAKVGGISLIELNMLEKEFLNLIGWHLICTGPLLQQYYASLVRSHPGYALAKTPAGSASADARVAAALATHASLAAGKQATGLASEPYLAPCPPVDAGDMQGREGTQDLEMADEPAAQMSHSGCGGGGSAMSDIADPTQQEGEGLRDKG